jgi:hypothetical protein
MNQLDEYVKLYKSTNKLSLHIHSHPEDSNIKTIIEKYGSHLVSIDTSLGNLSTLKVAQIINQVMNESIYDTDELFELEFFVKKSLKERQTN